MGIKQWFGGVMTFVPPQLEDDEWERDPGRAERMRALRDEREAAQVEDEELPGVSRVHWAPLRPVATKVAPKKPGFYAMRRKSDPHWTIVEVIEGLDGQMWYALGPLHPAHPVDDEGLLWGDRRYEVPR